MVECSSELDLIFAALAHPLRRDILRRGQKQEFSVSELAEPYGLSIAAISKHIQILEKAGLVTKERRGKQQFVFLSKTAFRDASTYLQNFDTLWNNPMYVFQSILGKL